jgi:hypothetical protein
MYGLTAGVGFTTAFKTYYTPSFEGFYLARLSRSIYAGGALNFQRYSFLYSANEGNPAYGDILSIRQKSDYLFFSPKIDLGLGYRKHVHLNFSLGPGLLLGGDKETSYFEPFYAHPSPGSGADTITNNTNGTMRTLIFHYCAGITERIPVGYWNIYLSQEVSYISSHLNFPGTNLNTSYIAFTFGLMHKYPQVAVEY